MTPSRPQLNTQNQSNMHVQPNTPKNPTHSKPQQGIKEEEEEEKEEEPGKEKEEEEEEEKEQEEEEEELEQ